MNPEARVTEGSPGGKRHLGLDSWASERLAEPWGGPWMVKDVSATMWHGQARSNVVSGVTGGSWHGPSLSVVLVRHRQSVTRSLRGWGRLCILLSTVLAAVEPDTEMTPFGPPGLELRCLY